MQKHIRNRIFMALVAIAVVCILVTAVFSAMGLTPLLRNAFGVVLTPFRYVATKTADAFDGFVSYFTDYNELNEENAQLKAELSEYREKLNDVEMLDAENSWLRKYLGIKREHIDFVLDSALVVGHDEGNYTSLLTLNRGSANGVEVGMAVITEDGVVGSITEVGLTWSKVTPILESNSSVGAYVERSNVVGVLDGDFKLRQDVLCRLLYVDSDADIKVGDKLLTSGLGSVYPRGLDLGEIVSITPDIYSRTVEISVKPAVDFSNISGVMIVTDYNIYSVPEGESTE